MYHIITNPVAGRGRSMQYQSQLVATLKEYSLECTTHVTEKPKDGYIFVKQIYEQFPNCKGIIGIGGDGTIQEIVAALAELTCNGEKVPIPLGIFPGGSGNDFAMTIEGGKAAYKKKYKKNMAAITKTLVERISANSTRTVDLITANGEAYLVAANIGLDARIVHNAIKYKPKYGGQAYLVAAYKSIMQHKNIPLQISVIDNGVIKENNHIKDYTLIAVCNNRTYGGGLCIAPPAKFDDGKITLCTVDGLSRPKLGVLFPSLLVEKHAKLKEINFIECTEVRITLPPGLNTEKLCMDGNLFPVEGEIHFKILPQVLDVFA